MPREKPKHGAFEFTIWLEDGARIKWENIGTRQQTNAEIAAAIRRYLVPLAERIEAKGQPKEQP